MSHGLPEVMLKNNYNEVILHGLQDVTLERQVISHGPSIMSMVSFVQNGRICIRYIYFMIK